MQPTQKFNQTQKQNMNEKENDLGNTLCSSDYIQSHYSKYEKSISTTQQEKSCYLINFHIWGSVRIKRISHPHSLNICYNTNQTQHRKLHRFRFDEHSTTNKKKEEEKNEEKLHEISGKDFPLPHCILFYSYYVE